jgi:LysR family nod box-dependent transcriptional activator
VLPGYAEHLRTGQIDLLILPREVASDVGDFASAPLFDDRFVGIAASDNRAVDGLTLQTFSLLPYLAYKVNGARSHVDKQLDELGVPRNVQMTTESFLIPPLVIAGSPLVAIIHERASTILGPTQGFRTFQLPTELPGIRQELYWHPRRTDDPAHAWLRERICEIAAVT